MNTLVISRNPIVWQSCDGRNSVEEIARSFQRKGLGKGTENFVWLAIDQLNEKSLLEHNIISEFHGQSRRTVLKTIGLVSVTALPVIASIATPTSAFAIISNCVCTSNVQCSQPINAGCPSTTICSSLGICAPNTPSQHKS